MKTYDCIVVGVGGMGGAALFHAARKGWSVMGLDRFPPGHDRGSSHGQTRIIRQAYFEHPNYVPLTLEAYGDWAELESLSQTQLFRKTGLLQVGYDQGPVVRGLIKAAEHHGLCLEQLAASQIEDRYPGFQVPPDQIGLLEENAGMLFVEQCVRCFADQAQLAGAELVVGQDLIDWVSRGDKITVRCKQAEYRAKRLIITVGAWARDLLPPEFGLRVVRKHLHWFATQNQVFFADHGCPTFLFETVQGVFYGFPQIDEQGFKVAEHTGGEEVSDPLNVDRSVDPIDLRRIKGFMQSYLKTDDWVDHKHAVCMYTLSPDDHFIVDLLKSDPRVAIACGMSGHGFKFAPVIGRHLVELLDGASRSSMEFLRPSRFDLAAD